MKESDGAYKVDLGELRAVVSRIFTAVGCPDNEAEVIAQELVTADQMGVHSHGVVRVSEYLDGVEAGRVTPGGKCSVARESAAAALVDGGGNFGQVVGRFALAVAAQKARETGTACVVTRGCYHLGRVGALMELATRDNLIAIATVAVGVPGLVAPWGAAEGVLGTNPFAYGVPIEGGAVVTDFATSTSAEGAVRVAHRDGISVPDGTLIDADGNATNDPAALFSDPPGALLPFGGALGYKGYALNLLPELIAAGLAGYGADDPTRPSNCLFLVVVDPAAFLPLNRFKELVQTSIRRVKNARPRRGQTVLLPGELEAQRFARSSSSVLLSPAILVEVDRSARRVGVAGFPTPPRPQ
jgi:hydroxycarboxylate dehydrogenase B